MLHLVSSESFARDRGTPWAGKWDVFLSPRPSVAQSKAMAKACALAEDKGFLVTTEPWDFDEERMVPGNIFFQSFPALLGETCC